MIIDSNLLQKGYNKEITRPDRYMYKFRAETQNHSLAHIISNLRVLQTFLFQKNCKSWNSVEDFLFDHCWSITQSISLLGTPGGYRKKPAIRLQASIFLWTSCLDNSLECKWQKFKICWCGCVHCRRTWGKINLNAALKRKEKEGERNNFFFFLNAVRVCSGNL